MAGTHFGSSFQWFPSGFSCILPGFFHNFQEFTNNLAKLHGGAIYTSPYSETYISSTVFIQNKNGYTNGKGGAVHFGPNTINSVITSLFQRNSAITLSFSSSGG